MRPIFFYILCVLFVPTHPYAYEKQARLHFTPNMPVYLTSKATLDVSQSLPGLSLTTRGDQTIKAVLTLKSDKQNLSGKNDPHQLTFVLKSIEISLRANDEELTFSSVNEDSSLYLSQVSNLVDRPINIQVGESFTLKAGGGHVQQIVNETPVLQQVRPEALLAELFLHIFAFEGENLFEGKKIERPFGLPDIPSMPKTVTYTVTSIDDFSVHADFSGKIGKQTYTLSQKVNINDKEEELVEVSLKGTMNGRVKWNRDNALLYELEANYNYSAMFKLGDWEWMMNIGVTLHNLTSLKK